MLQVCSICLRDNKDLRTLDHSDLTHFYEELCHSENKSHSHKFCIECIARLRKCRDFKIQCNKAKNLMSSWLNKQPNRDSVFELHRDMLTSNLSYCDRKNFKVFIFHTTDVASAASIQTYDSHPHIVTVNIPQDDNTSSDVKNPGICKDVIRNTASVGDGRNTMEFIKTDNFYDREIKVEITDENITDFNDDEEGLSGDEHVDKKNDYFKPVINDKRSRHNTFKESSGDEQVLSDDELIDLKKYKIKLEKNNKRLNHNKLKRANGDAQGLNDGKYCKIKLEKNKKRLSQNNLIESSGDDQGLSSDEGSTDDETNGSSDKDLTSDDEAFESDKSLQELIETLKEMPKIKYTTKNKKNPYHHYRFRTLNAFKKALKLKIKEIGVIKDDEGNAVDLDEILENSDIMPLNELRSCMQIINEEEFNYQNVQRLCEVQSKFVEYASVFDIQYLYTTEEVKEEFFRRTEYPDYLKSEFRCEDCFSGFKSRKSLDFHRRVLHNASHPVTCELCKVTFTEKKYLTNHWANMHITIYNCKKCPFIVSHKVGMEQHFRNHQGLKYRCEHCPAEYSCRSRWYLHMKKEHMVKKPDLYCEFCAYSTHSQIGFKLHKNRKHSGEKFVESEWNKKCEECDAVFITGDVYYKHLRISHKKTTNTNKKGHTNRKQANYIGTCRLCDDTGSNPGWLMKHYREAHPTESVELIYRDQKKFLCDTCGKGFDNEKTLEGHINTHTDTRPYVCPTCARAYHSRHKLLVHMVRHEPPKHVCHQCGKKFLTYGNLYTHSSTHRQDRSHICEYCNKGFKTKALLTEHVKGVHMNIRRKRKVVVKPMETKISE